MIKYTLTIDTDDQDDFRAIVNAVKNQATLDCIYDEVFRPTIKYSENKKEVKAYEMVWEKLSRYISDI